MHGCPEARQRHRIASLMPRRTNELRAICFWSTDRIHSNATFLSSIRLSEAIMTVQFVLPIDTVRGGGLKFPEVRGPYGFGQRLATILRMVFRLIPVSRTT